MRRLRKLAKPGILAENEAEWLKEYEEEPDSHTKRYRYRHAEIKAQLREETSHKCVYCESKIGHNTPGDIEHKVPSSKVPKRHFDWDNLTLACTECNRRKNDYYAEGDAFLDPYLDDVEEMLDHVGPFVRWKAGVARAEIAVHTLEFNAPARAQLILRKFEKLNDVAHRLERHHTEPDPMLKQLLLRQIRDMASVQCEFSAMVTALLGSEGMLA
jgi:hypothetical protein